MSTPELCLLLNPRMHARDFCQAVDAFKNNIWELPIGEDSAYVRVIATAGFTISEEVEKQVEGETRWARAEPFLSDWIEEPVTGFVLGDVSGEQLTRFRMTYDVQDVAVRGETQPVLRAVYYNLEREKWKDESTNS